MSAPEFTAVWQEGGGKPVGDQSHGRQSRASVGENAGFLKKIGTVAYVTLTLRVLVEIMKPAAPSSSFLGGCSNYFPQKAALC